MSKRISVEDFRMLKKNGKEELALIDVREPVDFGRKHHLYATCIPLSRLEVMAGDLLPCRQTQIVLTDGGGGSAGPSLADRAARVLCDMAHPLSRVNDVWIDACESEDATHDDMRDYIEWEEALLDQLKREDGIRLRLK